MNSHDEAIAYLRIHGKEIAADADGGSHEARQIMSVYAMYHRHADHPTLGVLLGTIDSWNQKNLKASRSCRSGPSCGNDAPYRCSKCGLRYCYECHLVHQC